MKTQRKFIAIVGTVVIVIASIVLFNRFGGSEKEGGKQASSSAFPAISPAIASAQPSAGSRQAPASVDNKPFPSPAPTPYVQMDIPSLAQTFKDYFPIGAAISPFETTGLTAELLKKHVNSLVAENVMKPDSIQPTEGSFHWEQADEIVKFAKANGMSVRFHTLVWHNQTPNWFFLDAEGKPMADETDPKKKEANKKLLLKRLDTYVRTVVGRYKNDIKSWDVVNEVVEPADPDGMRNSNWYKITGTEYIETAFRASREAGGPDLKLFINDYGTDDPAKRDRMYELVKKLLDKGVPINGIGHQTHINLQFPSVDAIITSMKTFHELGLDNIITELDMSLYTWDDRSDYGQEVPKDVLMKQADRYRELFNALKANKGLVSAVTFWGIADDHTWLSTFPIPRTEAPLLFDKNLQAKPAFWALVDPSKLN